jgi:hypothetical protein
VIDCAVVGVSDGGLDGAGDLVSARKIQTARGADARRMLGDVSTADEQGGRGVRSLDFFDQRVDPIPVETLLDLSTDVTDGGQSDTRRICTRISGNEGSSTDAPAALTLVIDRSFLARATRAVRTRSGSSRRHR